MCESHITLNPQRNLTSNTYCNITSNFNTSHVLSSQDGGGGWRVKVIGSLIGERRADSWGQYGNGIGKPGANKNITINGYRFCLLWSGKLVFCLRSLCFVFLTSHFLLRVYQFAVPSIHISYYSVFRIPLLTLSLARVLWLQMSRNIFLIRDNY